LGEPGVAALVGQILEDSRPLFRSTGAWVMGKIGAPHFVQPLQRALADAEPGVRHAARRALVEIRKRTAQDQSPPVSTPPPEVAPELPTAAGPTAIADAAPPQPPQGSEGVHASTT
jgi:hypothetical protein